MNIAINGFGRIGRAAFKIFLERAESLHDLHVVAINDLTTPEVLAYLLKYDSVYGRYEKPVSFTDSDLVIGDKNFPVLAVKDPLELPWKDLNVDIVLECTGFFTKAEDAKKHLQAGAKKVILSAPAKDDEFTTIVLGTEDIDYSKELYSNASCTTNCAGPVMHVLSKTFGIEKAMLSTVHAYTSTQGLIDGPDKGKDMRRGRAAAANIVPSSTGAAESVAKVIPELENIFDGIALRVPVICGSISDITALLKRNTTVEEINKAFSEAQNWPEMEGILKYSEEVYLAELLLKEILLFLEECKEEKI